MSETVLVTGGSGFIASHCIIQLLAEGYVVRTTVRSLKREDEVKSTLKASGAAHLENLSFVEADLTKDAGWPQATAGCDYVLHVASPFPAKQPENEDELIIPARDGTLRVLKAARDAHVKRVVLTSSFAAIGYGHPHQAKPFDEASWTNLQNPDVNAYARSKTIAEKAAWDFISSEGGDMELTVINPVGVFGPALGSDYATSILLVRRFMDGFPGCPRIQAGAVDVRDVADMHVRAMKNPQAKGERFLAVAEDFITLLDIAKILKTHMGTAGKRVSLRELPDWLLRVISLFDSDVRGIVPELGKKKNATGEKARRVLGMKFRSSEESILATANSLVSLGLVKS